MYFTDCLPFICSKNINLFTMKLWRVVRTPGKVSEVAGGGGRGTVYPVLESCFVYVKLR